MTAEFWITTAAIVIGPIIAVLIAQLLQNKVRRRERQEFVFRTLMSTRKAQLSPERVAALNLIEVEFSDKKKVMAEFRKLISLYNDRVRWQSTEQAVRQQLLSDIDDQSVRLVAEIGACLGYRYDQIELMRGGYHPEAFALQEEQQMLIREFLVGLRTGQLAVPISVIDHRHEQKLLGVTQDNLGLLETRQDTGVNEEAGE